MKSLGVRRESVDEVTFAEGPYPLDDPEVLAIAESIREVGLLQPVGRSTEGVGLWGRRRWTAVKFVLERKEVLTHTCEVEPGEEDIIRDVENTHRSDLPPMEREIALARIANRFEVARSPDETVMIPDEAPGQTGIAIPVSGQETSAQKRGGRGKKRGAAKAAEAAGVDKRTVNTAIANVEALSPAEQKALSKAHATHAQIRDAAKLTGLARASMIAALIKAAKKAEREADSEPDVPRDETGTGERLGNPLPAAVEVTFRPTLLMCTKLRAQLVAARVEAERVKNVWDKYHQPLRQTLNGRWSDLLANLDGVGAAAMRVGSHEVPNLIACIKAVDAGMPYALCPHCKGLPAAIVTAGKIKGQRFGGMAECKTCNGFGWVDEARYRRVADAFRVYSPIAGTDGQEMQPLVYVHNHGVPVTALDPIEEAA